MNFLEEETFYPGVSGKQFLYNIFLRQVQNATLYFNTIPKKQQLKILSTICEINLSKNPALILEKWISLCYLSTIMKSYTSIDDEEIHSILTEIKMKRFSIPDSLYLLPLDEKKNKSKDAFMLYQFFSSSSSVQANSAKNPQLLHSLQILFTEHQGLYIALLRHGYLNDLLSQFSYEDLFNTFKLQSFSLKENFDKNFLQFFSVDMINSSNFGQFWELPSILLNSEVPPLFQSLFACASPFPSISKYFPYGENLNDSILSLINDVLSKRNKCFVDIILIRCRTLIIDGLLEKKDQQLFLKYTSEFPDLQILTFLTEYESLKNDINNFRNVIWQLTDESSPLYSISSTTCAPILIDILIRLKNDQLFFDLLKGATGINTPSNAFDMISIPLYLLQKSILLIDISEFYNRKMFIITDDDRKCDSLFIFIYQIIDCIINQKSIDQIVILIEMIKEITNEVIFQNIIIDLFSLLFVTNRSNADFYFNSIYMSDIVTLLLKFSPKQKHIKAALLRLKVANLISQNKFDEIKQLAENDQDFIYKLATILEIIQKYRNGEPALFPNDIDKSLLAAEYFLSFNEEIGFDTGSICPQLISLRKKSKIQPLYFYDIDSTKSISSLSLSELIDNSNILDNCQSLKGFIEIEKIIQSSDDFDLNKMDDLIKIIIKGEKVSSILTMKTVPDEYKNNKIISHVILKDKKENKSYRFDSIENISDYLTEIDRQLISITSEHLILILSKCFSMNEYPYDILNDLYYRNSEVVFNYYQGIVTQLKVKDLLNLVPYCYYKSLYLIAGNEKMNLSECLNNLVEKGQLKEAKEISLEFGFDLEKIIKQNINESNLNEIQTQFQLAKRNEEMSRNEIELKSMADYFIQTKLDKPSFGELFKLFSYIQNEADRISTRLMDDLINLANFFISNSFVDSVQTEINAYFIFPRLLAFLNLFKVKMINISDAYQYESLFNQLECICQFVSSCFYGKFNQEYSFIDYSSHLRGIQYASICMKYDRIDILDHIQSSWILPDCRFFSSSLNCFKMGLINIGLQQFKRSVKAHQALKIDCQSLAIELIPILSLLQPINVTSFIPVMESLTHLKFDSNLQFSVYNSLKNSFSTNDLNHTRQPHSTYPTMSSFIFINKKSSANSITSSTDSLLDTLPANDISMTHFPNSNSYNEIDHIDDSINHSIGAINQSMSQNNNVIDNISKSMNQNNLSLDNRNVHSSVNNYYISFDQNSSSIDKSNYINTVDCHTDVNNEKFELPSVQKEIIKEIINANRIAFIDSPQLKVLDQALSLIGSNEDRIQFFCRYGQFDEAFSLFKKSFISTSSGANFSAFLRDLVAPSLAFQQWNMFWRRLLKMRSAFDPLINDFIAYLKKNEMYYMLYLLEKKIGHCDSSLYAALKLFERSTSWKEREVLLNDMRTLISKSLEDADNQHSTFFTTDRLFQLQWRVSIQLPIVSLFIAEKVPFDKDLELMTSQENTLKLASFLLIMLQVGYFSEICELPDVSINEVCEVAIEKLANDGEKRIPQFLKQLTRLEFGSYKKIIMCISQSIYRRVPDENSFVEFVRNNIKGDTLVAAVLQNFGFEQEALDTLRHRNRK